MLVMTDYPDLLDQSRELKQISGEYELNSYTSSSRMPTTSILKFIRTTTWTTAFSCQTQRVIIGIIWRRRSRGWISNLFSDSCK